MFMYVHCKPVLNQEANNNVNEYILKHFFLLLDELLPHCPNSSDELHPLFHNLGQLDCDGEARPPVQQPEPSKHQPRVPITAGRGEIYKATLVSLLNEDPQLSHDR